MSLVDLAATATACEDLAAWWQGFNEGTEDLYQLEAARRSLQRLAPQPGPVGEAVSLIAAGGEGVTGERLLSAMNLLVRVAAWRPPRDPARSTRRISRHRPPPSARQQPLPGLGTSPPLSRPTPRQPSRGRN